MGRGARRITVASPVPNLGSLVGGATERQEGAGSAFVHHHQGKEVGYVALLGGPRTYRDLFSTPRRDKVFVGREEVVVDVVRSNAVERTSPGIGVERAFLLLPRGRFLRTGGSDQKQCCSEGEAAHHYSWAGAVHSAVELAEPDRSRQAHWLSKRSVSSLVNLPPETRSSSWDRQSCASTDEAGTGCAKTFGDATSKAERTAKAMRMGVP